jgi:hypothetical protein
MLSERSGNVVLVIGLAITGIILVLEGWEVYMTPDSGPGVFLALIGVLCLVMAVFFARDDLWFTIG